MAETPLEMVQSVLKRLETDEEYRRQFQQGVLGKLVLDELFEARDQVKALREQLEAGGANGAVAEELAQARVRIAELEEQLADRPAQTLGREPDPEFVALYNKARDEWLKRPGVPQKLAPVKRKLSADDWDRLINFNLAGICGALLRGDSDDIKSEEDGIAKFIEQARRKASLDRQERPAVSPTPAPAGASSSGQGFNLSE